MRGWQYVCILGDGSMCVYEGMAVCVCMRGWQYVCV